MFYMLPDHGFQITIPQFWMIVKYLISSSWAQFPAVAIALAKSSSSSSMSSKSLFLGFFLTFGLFFLTFFAFWFVCFAWFDCSLLNSWACFINLAQWTKWSSIFASGKCFLHWSQMAYPTATLPEFSSTSRFSNFFVCLISAFAKLVWVSALLDSLNGFESREFKCLYNSYDINSEVQSFFGLFCFFLLFKC